MRRSQPGSRLWVCSPEKTGGSADLRAILINLTSPLKSLEGTADQLDPELHALEPNDIHMVRML